MRQILKPMSIVTHCLILQIRTCCMDLTHNKKFQPWMNTCEYMYQLFL